MRFSRSDIERHIGDLAEAFGWRHHHAIVPGVTRDGYRDGFPTDVAVRGGRLVFVIVSDPGEHAPERAWARDLEQVSRVEVHTVNGSVHELYEALRGDRQ